ncbi:MAG: hypothetical protein HQM08_20145 [Candidatus Riflebacteria bacterium]|nr:hypothetical protein [Candidatus Riflebacteria bacterium]
MNKIVFLARKPHFPLTMMILFFFFLCVVLALRVYFLDSELATRQISEIQAMLAGQAGVHIGITRIRQEIAKEGGTRLPVVEDLMSPRWRPIGLFSDSGCRILEVRPLPGVDNPATPLIDESSLYRIESEGRSGSSNYRVWGTIGIIPIVKRFAVFNSLNEYYYGKPLLPWIQEFGNLENFRKSNFSLFQSGILNNFGVCYDPDFLIKLFKTGEPDPFNPPTGKDKFKGNYGTMFFSREGPSPCNGPLYCQTPIVIDNHQFFGPIQTASYLYRRGTSRPSLKVANSVLAIPSSRRIQKILDNLEAELPEGPFVDADSTPKTAFLTTWKPDYESIRQKAKKDGLYIDPQGRPYLRGEKLDMDYHFENQQIFSESYLTSNESEWRQDEISGGFVTLATANRFDGKNNLAAEVLKGVSVVFSENSVFIRCEIGGDMVLCTPRHILLTGSVNSESGFNLLMIAGNGIGISTKDLEKYIEEQKPPLETIQAATQWIINAVLYRPGAGWYGSWAHQLSQGQSLNPASEGKGEKVSLKIVGACIEGNLQRWFDNAGKDGIKVDWKPTAVDHLPFVPVSVNLLRIRTLPNN